MSDLHERLSNALSDRYELGRELGRGGMAVVYLATDLKQGRQVALKVFQPDVAAAMGPARFQREIEIATRLEHPHILSLYDSGEAEGLLYYVMPYVEEESLRQRLDREGQLPIEDALRIAREMAEALDYAHEQGVVHRDVKPGNVLLQRGHALLADFGVARALEDAGGDRLTKTGVSVGTPHYMAPEQATGAEAADARSDVYAVGAVLYEMLTGEPPYTGATPQAVLARRLAGPPTPIPVLRETVPPELDAVVQKSMARSAADRWQSAGDLAKALAAAERGGTPIPGLSTWPGVTGEVAGVGDKAVRGKRRVTIGAIAAAAVAAVLLGTGNLDFLMPNPETDPFLVAVMPARPAVGPDRLAARAIGNSLDGWAYLHQAEPSRIDARMAREDTQTFGPDEALSVAQDVGVGRFVLVRSEEVGSDLNVQAELYVVGDSVVRVTAVDTTGSYAEFAEDWHLDVLLRLFKDQGLGASPELRRAEWIADPRAMYPYFEALARFEEGQVDSSVAYLQAAVAIDSTFGEAWNRLEYAAWQSMYRAGNAGDTAASQSYRLIMDSASSAASRFFQPRATAVGLAQARLEAEVFRDSAEVQYETGRLYDQAALGQGFDSDSARQFYERALALDPDQNANRLFYLHLFHNRLDEATRIAERYSVEGGFAVGLHKLALKILQAPDRETRDSLLIVYAREYPGMGPQGVWRSLMWQDSVAVSRYMAEFLDPDTSAAPAEVMAFVELAAGRGTALGALIDDHDPLWCDRGSERYERDRCYTYRAIMQYRASVNMPGGFGESADIVRDLYEYVRGASYVTRNGWIGQMGRLWHLGMLSVRLGEIESAAGYADSMSQLAADSIPEEAPPSLVLFGNDLPAEVNAAIALEDGDLDTALELLEGVTSSNDSPPGLITRRRPFSRLARGNILLEKGRFVEADGWFATFPDFEPPNEEFAFLSQALRGRAIAHDSLGRHEEALHYYRRFVTRWQDADPHLQPQVEEARQRIRELEAELD